MNKSLALGAGLLAVMSAASPALAQHVGCPYYQPGLIAFVTGIRPANCVYQGDYLVKQGPTYDGPAIVAPQPTYAPTPSTPAYMHGAAYHMEPGLEPLPPRAIIRRPAVRPVKRIVSRRPVVNVRSELPPRKGRPQVVKATAEVRIYGPERMDIRLYRR